MSRASLSAFLILAAAGCGSATDEAGSASDTPGNGKGGADSECCPAPPFAGGAASQAGANTAGSAGAPIVTAGCPDDLWREAEAVASAAEATIAAATELSQRVSVACNSLHDELAPNDGAEDNTPTTVQSACLAAQQTLATLHSDEAAILSIEGGQCRVVVSEQVDCEQICNNDCSPGSIDERCATEYLFGQCDGVCENAASCEGSIGSAAPCAGECTGLCSGTCSEACLPAGNQVPPADTCEGYCGGVCDGTCTGACTISLASGLSCGTESSCQGACSSRSEIVDCVRPLTLGNDATCALSENCYQACAGLAALAPTCEAPTVGIFSGFPTSVSAILQAYLPPLLRTAGGDGPLAVSVVPGVLEAADRILAELDADPTCLASFGVENTRVLTDAAAAGASIDSAVESATLVVSEAFGESEWRRLQ